MAFFFFLSILVTLLPFSAIAANNGVPSLYVFGDSIVDAGNNNFLRNKAQANHYPYGIDFQGGTPTGRYTNGKTVVDFIAEYLGLPLVPPYMGMKKKGKKEASITGINFASGASGILKETGNIAGEVLPLETQIKLFEKTLNKYLPQGEEDLEATVSNSSIFYISTYGNDISINYLFYPEMKATYTPESFADHLLEQYTKLLEHLYILGARKFVLTHLAPQRCLPELPDIKVKCNDTKMMPYIIYNKKFDSSMTTLKDRLPGCYFTVLQQDVFFADIISNSAKYGFQQQPPCCPLSDVGGCDKAKAPCENRDKFALFDAVHPTQIVHELMAKKCIDGSMCKPLSLKQLVDIKA